MTQDTVLDTTIAEPPTTGSEVDMLLFALRGHAHNSPWKCGGLDAAGPTKAHPPSTLGGLLKHLAFLDDWTAVRLAAQPMLVPWTAVDWEADPTGRGIRARAAGSRRLPTGGVRRRLGRLDRDVFRQVA